MLTEQTKDPRGREGRLPAPTKTMTVVSFKTHREGHKPGLKVLVHFSPFAFFYPIKATEKGTIAKKSYLETKTH